MPRTITTAVLFTALCSLASLAGCGQMGPLYMPSPEISAGSQPAPAPATSQLSAPKPVYR